MSVTIVPFREAHLDEAATMVARGYNSLRSRVASLPDRYADPETIRPMLSALSATVSGVAGVERDELRGFMLGMHLDDWRGRRTAYVPEWAHAAARGDLEHTYERLYAAAAAEWAGAGLTTHLITVQSDADDAMHALHWMGYGMCGLDLVRDLSQRDPKLPPGRPKGARARRAGPDDVETVQHLAGELRHYLAGPPVYLPAHDAPEPYLQEWLEGSTGAIWLAERAGHVLGLMGVGPGGDDRCQWLQDEGTAGIRPAQESQRWPERALRTPVDRYPGGSARPPSAHGGTSERTGRPRSSRLVRLDPRTAGLWPAQEGQPLAENAIHAQASPSHLQPLSWPLSPYLVLSILYIDVNCPYRTTSGRNTL